MSTAIYVEHCVMWVDHCVIWVEPCDLSRALRYLNRALRAKSNTARQNKYVHNENAVSLTERNKQTRADFEGGKRKRFSNASNQPKCNVLRAKEIYGLVSETSALLAEPLCRRLSTSTSVDYHQFSFTTEIASSQRRLSFLLNSG